MEVEGGGVAPRRKHASVVKQASESRLARVESLRAVAALSVALGHAWGFGHGFGTSAYDTYWERIIYGGGFAVFLFFALSGYLLFWPFARRYFADGARIDLRRYAVNRAVRILPLYWAVVIILLLFQEGGGTFEQWWRFMLLWENFSYETAGTVDGALWSVVVEIHFYLLLPFLAAGLARVGGGRRRPAVLALLALGAASLVVWLFAATLRDHPDRLWFHNLPGTFFYFVPGMLLAFARLEIEERRPGWLKGVLGHSTTWIAASIAIFLVVFYEYKLSPLCALAAFPAVGACVLPLREGRLVRLLDWRPLAAVGIVSYSLYVWHTRVMEHMLEIDGFPAGTVWVVGLGIPASIAVGVISYKIIEEPFLRLRRRWSDASAPIPEADQVQDDKSRPSQPSSSAL